MTENFIKSPELLRAVTFPAGNTYGSENDDKSLMIVLSGLVGSL